MIGPIAAVCLAVLQAPSAQDSIAIDSLLVIERVGKAGRAPVFTDAIEAQRGKKISNKIADMLIEFVSNVTAHLPQASREQSSTWRTHRRMLSGG